MGVMVLSGLCAWAVCPQKEAMQVGGGRMLHCSLPRWGSVCQGNCILSKGCS